MGTEDKKRRTERVRKVTAEQIEKALMSSAGILSNSAHYLERVYGIKISRQALSYRVQKSKKLQAVRQEARETILDKAESVLIAELAKGNWKVALSLLRTLGKNRGYTEKVIHSDKEETEQQTNTSELLVQVLEKVWEVKNAEKKSN